MRVHSHGNADGPKDHGHQADQAQDRGRVIQSLAKRRIALAKIHHLRIGQRFLHLLAHGHRVRGNRCVQSRLALLRQFQQQPLAGPASRSDEPGLVQGGLRNHHPRPQACAGRKPVRLLLQHRRNLEVPPAQPQRLPHLRVQPDEKLLRHHHRIPGQSLRKGHRRLELSRSVIRILVRVDGLERNQQRHRIRRHRRHGNGLRHPCRSNSASVFIQKRSNSAFVVVCRRTKQPSTQVSRHE